MNYANTGTQIGLHCSILWCASAPYPLNSSCPGRMPHTRTDTNTPFPWSLWNGTGPGTRPSPWDRRMSHSPQIEW